MPAGKAGLGDREHPIGGGEPLAPPTHGVALTDARCRREALAEIRAAIDRRAERPDELLVEQRLIEEEFHRVTVTRRCARLDIKNRFGLVGQQRTYHPSSLYFLSLFPT